MTHDAYGALAQFSPTVAIEPSMLERVVAQIASRVTAQAPASVGIENTGTVAVVTIEGPLYQRGWEWRGVTIVDGYDLIEKRLRAATATGPLALLLHIDSPGGDASGLMEGVRRMRNVIDVAGIPVVAYVDELGASAGYALATLADTILLPAEAQVGSIGTWAAHVDLSRYLEEGGARVTVIRDPKGKAVPNSFEPLEEEGRSRLQARVDELTAGFVQLVATRRGLSTQAVRDTNAALYTGAKAVKAGLADGVSSYEAAVAMAEKLGRKKRRERMTNEKVLGLFGLKEGASDDEIAAAAESAAPTLALGRMAKAVTGAKSAEEGAGVLAAWKKSHEELPAERAELARIRGERAQSERTTILEGLVRDGKATPAEVWKGGDKAKGPTDFFGPLIGTGDDVTGMSLGQLRAYAAASAPRLEKLRSRDEPAGSAVPKDQAQALARANRLPGGMEWLAEAELEARANNGTDG